MNLLNETIEILKENGKTEKDVKWCGSNQYGYFNWKNFAKLANEEYDEVLDDFIKKFKK